MTSWLDYFPFLTVASADLKGRRMDWNEIIKTLIIGAVTAGIVTYANMEVLGAKLDDMRSDMAAYQRQTDSRFASIQNQLYYGTTRRPQ